MFTLHPWNEVTGADVQLEENVNVELAKNLEDLNQRTEEAKQWRQYLKTIDPGDCYVNTRIGGS